MKTYKDFEKIFLGSSDIASLTMRNWSEVRELDFGEDGDYCAYFVTEEAEIGQHYHKVATYDHWLWVYDDNGKTVSIIADEITVYRAGQFGCIIYAPGGWKED